MTEQTETPETSIPAEPTATERGRIVRLRCSDRRQAAAVARALRETQWAVEALAAVGERLALPPLGQDLLDRLEGR